MHFKGREIAVREGANLRKALLKAGLSPYNGAAHQLNCRGLGTCGTCAVAIEGRVNEKTKIEKWRLNFPPHREERGLRLSCQVKVLGKLNLTKHEGFWGERV